MVHRLTCPFVPERVTTRRLVPVRLGTLWARSEADGLVQWTLRRAETRDPLLIGMWASDRPSGFPQIYGQVGQLMKLRPRWGPGQRAEQGSGSVPPNTSTPSSLGSVRRPTSACMRATGQGLEAGLGGPRAMMAFPAVLPDLGGTLAWVLAGSITSEWTRTTTPCTPPSSAGASSLAVGPERDGGHLSRLRSARAVRADDQQPLSRCPDAQRVPLSVPERPGVSMRPLLYQCRPRGWSRQWYIF